MNPAIAKPAIASHRRLWITLLIVIIVFGAALRIWTIGFKAPWNDEVHSLLYLRRSFAHLLDINRTSDIHPPFYFMSLKAWAAAFGDSREAGRMFSVVLGVASIGLIFAITRRLLGIPAALIAAGFFASLPIAVHYAREIRMYPLLTFLFLLSFLCFLNFFRQGADQAEPISRRRKLWSLAGFSVSLALTFYTHYTAAILYMLYTLAGLYFLIRHDRAAFFWTFLGLAIATLLVSLQIKHLLFNAMGQPSISWMEPTTWKVFYSMTMGAFPYHKLLKPLFFLAFAAGFFLLWRRDSTVAVVVFLFTGGGMIIAAVIGIFEPIYLVRTIQVYASFSAILVAMLLISVPRNLAVVLGLGLLAGNVHAVVQNELVSAREPMLAERIAGLVDMIDPARDQMFSMTYLTQEMLLYRVPLFEKGRALSHETYPVGRAQIEAQAARCVGAGAQGDCRSVILILEKASKFNTSAIAAWNDLADSLKASNPNNIETLIAGFRVIVLSDDSAFLARAARVLNIPAP